MQKYQHDKQKNRNIRKGVIIFISSFLTKYPPTLWFRIHSCPHAATNELSCVLHSIFENLKQIEKISQYVSKHYLLELLASLSSYAYPTYSSCLSWGRSQTCSKQQRLSHSPLGQSVDEHKFFHKRNEQKSKISTCFAVCSEDQLEFMESTHTRYEKDLLTCVDSTCSIALEKCCSARNLV